MTVSLEALLSGSATVDWVNPAMTGTTKRVTEAVDLLARAGGLSWAPAWTDSTGVTGAFGVEISNDGIGWITGVLDTDFSAIGDAPSADSGTQVLHAGVRARYARLTYTNATNAGTLTQGVHVQGKRGGQSAASGDTVESIAGDSLLLHYLGNEFEAGDAGAPDVDKAINLQLTAAHDIVQATDTKQPHSGVVNGLHALTFANGAAQELRALGVPAFLAIGDYVTIIVVAQPDTITATKVMLEIGTNNVATGLVIYTVGNAIRVQASTQTGGQKTLDSAAYTETGEYGVFQADLSAAGLKVLVNDETPVTSGPWGGLDKAQTGIAMGNATGGGFFFGGAIAQAVVLKNADSDTVDAMHAFLIANPGIAA